MNHYLYLDVKVIKTGKVGIVLEVNEFNRTLLVEFNDGSHSWESESDVIEVVE